MNNQPNQPSNQKPVPPPATQSTPKRSNRGFAGMDAAKHKAISAKGGRASHQKQGPSSEATSSNDQLSGQQQRPVTSSPSSDTNVKEDKWESSHTQRPGVDQEH